MSLKFFFLYVYRKRNHWSTLSRPPSIIQQVIKLLKKRELVEILHSSVIYVIPHITLRYHMTNTAMGKVTLRKSLHMIMRWNRLLFNAICAIYLSIQPLQLNNILLVRNMP